MIMKFALATAAAIASLGGAAEAAVTVYTTQSSFLAAVSNAGVDTFDTFSNTGSTPSPIVRTAGGYGYTAAVSTTTFYGAGSGSDHWLSTNTATDAITFGSFTGGVAGLGGFFFDSNISGAFAAGDIMLSATDADGTVLRTITGATTGSFVGFVSTLGALSSATVAAVQPAVGAVWPTVNNLTLASAAEAAVPEPSSWALMLLGFGTIGTVMRRGRTGAVATL